MDEGTSAGEYGEREVRAVSRIFSIVDNAETERIEEIISYLDAPHPFVRRCAILAVGRLGSIRHLSHIRRFLSDEDVLLRACAVASFERLLARG